MPRYPLSGHIFFGGFGWIFSLIFWIILILAVFAFVEAITSDNHHQNPRMDADDESLKILRERYAAGKISKKEFQETKDALLS